MYDAFLRPFVIVVALLAFFSACSRGSQHCGTCPSATYDVRATADSTVSWTFRDIAPVTTTGFVPAPVPPDGCSLRFEKAKYATSLADAGLELWYGSSFDIHCGGGGHGTFDVFAAMPGDPRDWPVGSFPFVSAKGTADISYLPSTATNGPIATDCETAILDGLVMTVTVETATGSGEPFPQLVSGDFVRTFHLEFHTSMTTPTTPGSSSIPCTPAVTADVSLHLEQTAADYVLDPQAPCSCD